MEQVEEQVAGVTRETGGWDINRILRDRIGWDKNLIIILQSLNPAFYVKVRE